MPVPKKRHSRSRQNKRRANYRVKAVNLSTCPQCHAPTLPHHACPTCGTYRGRTVLEVGKKEKSAKGGSLPGRQAGASGGKAKKEK